MVTLSGSIPHGVPTDIYAQWIELANSKGAKVILDASGEALVKGIESKPFMIKPFQSFYDVTYEGDNLLLDGEVTNITSSGITAFYEYCSQCIKDKEIPRLISGGVDHLGKRTKKNKTLLYDPFKDADTGSGFDAWVADCMRIAEAM